MERDNFLMVTLFVFTSIFLFLFLKLRALKKIILNNPFLFLFSKFVKYLKIKNIKG